MYGGGKDQSNFHLVVTAAGAGMVSGKIWTLADVSFFLTPLLSWLLLWKESCAALVGWPKLVGRVSSSLCLELVLRSWERLISCSLTLLPVNGGYYKDQTQKWMRNSRVVCETQTKC